MGYCHCCGDAANDLTCPVCGEPTCSACITTMPAVEGRPPSGCVDCESEAWWEMWRETRRQVEGWRLAMEKTLRGLVNHRACTRPVSSEEARLRARVEVDQGCRESAEKEMREVLGAFMDANGWS